MDAYQIPPGAGAGNAPSAPSSTDIATASVPRDLKGYSETRLLAMSTQLLEALCVERGLAKGGSKADKVLRLTQWKKQNKPKGEKKERKRAREEESSSAPSSQQSVIVNVTIGAGSGEPTVASASNAAEEFTLGKHKGKTFRYVMANEKGYCDWAMGQVAPSSNLLDFQQFLKKQGYVPSPPAPRAASAPPDGSITSGKHKGETFSSVWAKDKSYCNWVLTLSSSELAKAPWMKGLRTYLEHYSGK